MVLPLSLSSLCTIALWLPGNSLGLDLCPYGPGVSIAAAMWVGTSQTTVEQVRRSAKAITVIVWVDDRWSSGILVDRHGPTHTVITNQHVVDFGETFQVMLSDGQRYDAHLRPSRNTEQNDLAILEFQSTAISYPVATFAPSLSLLPGVPVFAAGFPIATNLKSQPQFHFTSGQVSFISERVLKGGYQLGYTNPIKKGMSGGPVLNRWGQVIAINGIHAYPLWGNPYIFVDGSRPNAAEHAVMKQSSWAIPAERFLKWIPSAPTDES